MSNKKWERRSQKSIEKKIWRCKVMALMEIEMRSTGKIAIAVNGQVMRDYGGWYWPMTDIGAWADEKEMRRLGHTKLADQIAAAIAEAKSQKESMNYETL